LQAGGHRFEPGHVHQNFAPSSFCGLRCNFVLRFHIRFSWGVRNNGDSKSFVSALAECCVREVETLLDSLSKHAAQFISDNELIAKPPVCSERLAISEAFVAASDAKAFPS
jgi:hypothetical protein